MRNIQLVCFDIGGVLVQLCDGWTHACQLAGVPAPVAESERDERDKATLVELVHRCDLGLKIDEFAELVAPILRLRPEHVIALSNAYLRGQYPGSIELVEELMGRGVKTACLSNTNENHWRIMQDPSQAAHWPLEKLTYRFASHLVGMRKPEDRIFQHVEKVTGLRPEEILFFDDVAENTEAAGRHGWKVCRIDASADPMQQAREYLRGCRLLG